MSDLPQIVSKSIFARADREAKFFNRYNPDSRDLEFAYKEGFYQKRIEELLKLIPREYLEKCHAIMTKKGRDTAT